MNSFYIGQGNQETFFKISMSVTREFSRGIYTEI